RHPPCVSTLDPFMVPTPLRRHGTCPLRRHDVSDSGQRGGARKPRRQSPPWRARSTRRRPVVSQRKSARVRACAEAASGRALPLLTTTFAAGPARNRALGLYGATGSVGFVAGLVLGGALVTGVGWRAVFWVNVPIAIAAALLGWRSLPLDRHTLHRGRLDLVGAILVTFAMAALVYLPSALSTDGRGPRSALADVPAVVVLLAALVV